MTDLRPSAALGLLIVVMVTVTGCLNLDPRGNPTKYYLLGGTWSAEASERTADNLSVGLRPLVLAAYLQTPEMVVREGPHRIRFATYHRWGEDLNRGINRSVAGYLVAAPGVRRVDVVPWPRGAVHDYTVELRVLRFEGVEPEGPPPEDEEAAWQGRAHVLIAWEITAPGAGQVLASGTHDAYEDAWTVGDYDALADLLDASLETLAGELATEMARLTR